MSIAVSLRKVSVIFGRKPQEGLEAADRGLDREAVKAATGQIMGAHDCSLEVPAGQTVVLMGLSGSGKSTLLRTVNGLAPVSRGQVLVRTADGVVDIGKADARSLRALRLRQVSMVFQQFGLLPWRTVRDNVGLGPELSHRPRAEREARIKVELATVGLADWADRRLGELSGGMQQRVGLARAFATDAPILLMDEPFSALDPLIRRRLQDELLDLQARRRRTILFVSHDLDEAIRLGRLIALMEGGRIIQTGTARQIMANPATDYVRDFVAHLDPLEVLLVGDLAEVGGAEGVALPRDLPLRDASRRLARVEALPVEGGGRLTRAAILSRLAR